MKTKIIYISGSDLFDIADIRGAFEEVRTALNLNKDTVLFGVPVDSDDALAGQFEGKKLDEGDVKATVEAEPKVEDIQEETPVINAPLAEEASQIINKPEEKTEDAAEEKIIPILSILSNKQAEATEEQKTIEPEEENEEVITPEEENEEVIEIEDKKEEKPIVSTYEMIEEDIEDMITGEAPEEPVEKTLEQLLESMTPLQEDSVEEHHIITQEEESIEFETSTDTDATLEQLASEFVEKEDTIVASPKNESHGKIGKLKNILPFKKAKKEDPGIMGDLFGWAGLAANDDDVAFPSFFTTGTAKK